MYKNGEKGRSMIEMLGVLAIISVLTVGGIAGYSKAMEKWKINKTLEGYSFLTQGLMEHIDNLRVLQPTDNTRKHYLLETIKELNLIPEGWSIQNQILTDTTGSTVTVFARNNHLVYDIELGTYSFDGSNNIKSDNFSVKLCREFISNFAQPLHSSLQYIWIFTNQGKNKYYYGDSSCTNDNKCLINMTLSDIQNACTSCVIGTDYCLLVLEF